MKLLIPLGLLGLLGIVILIIIYIIKPNYQQKLVSSTFVWKLSLKLKRKKLPTNKLRNILIFVCQVLILAAMAGILAKPVIMKAMPAEETDVIAIIDSSASMYAQTEDETRFERAVNGVKELAASVVDGGGYMSVIIADDSPSFLDRRVSLNGREELIESLDALIAKNSIYDPISCSYGTSDMDKALELAEEVLEDNAAAQIYIYTDTEYTYVPDGITVVSVAESTEWNMAILDAYTELEDGVYTITVELACYGVDMQTTLFVSVNNANAYDKNSNGEDIEFTQLVYCEGDETKKVVFKYSADGVLTDTENIVYYPIGTNDRIYSYQSIHIYVEENDSFSEDNTFEIYGGQKEVLKVQYYSSAPNSFYINALAALSNTFANIGEWDLQVTEVKANQSPALSGFDFYIFEHKMPDTLPIDGVVLLVDPDKAPASSGFQVISDNSLGQLVSFTAEATENSQSLLNYISADRFMASRYTRIVCDSAYETVLACNGDPMLIVENDEARKIAVMPFSVHYSNIALLPEYIYLLYNMFEYFIPSTTSGFSFAVNEEIAVNSRGDELTIQSSNNSKQNSTITEFPSTITLALPGTYTLTQTTYFGKEVSTDIFIKIPSSESNIRKVEDGLNDPVRVEEDELTFDDLLIYLAAAMVLLLFVEWILHTRDSI
jgi:hypothetical protein